LRTLAQARQSYVIQHQAVALAERRVDSTNAFLQAGRAEVRDLLDAQESLLEAQNALTAALVDYRVAELELQRDMGLLRVDAKGLWHEYQPDNVR
jgi:outer membrane protein TolC